MSAGLNGSGTPPGISTDELRAMVRAVLMEIAGGGQPGSENGHRRGPEPGIGATPGARCHHCSAAAPSATDVRVDRGAVTERMVARAAADGARLVLGPRAVLTPLARDKARTLGVPIEKER